jgi:plasmid maintenance system antidote protein VapI
MKTNLPKLSGITPGEILLEDWIKAHELACAEVAGRTGIAAS